MVPCGSPARGLGSGEAEAVGDTLSPLIFQELFSESLRLPSASCQGHPVLPTALAHTICHSRERQGPHCCVSSGMGCERWTMGLSLWEAAMKSPGLLYKNMKGSCGPPATPQRKCGVSQVRHLKKRACRNIALLPSWLHMPFPWLWRMQGPEVVEGFPAVPQSPALPRGVIVLAGSHYLFSL